MLALARPYVLPCQCQSCGKLALREMSSTLCLAFAGHRAVVKQRGRPSPSLALQHISISSVSCTFKRWPATVGAASKYT